ncbi:MAG: PepSY domain-containing protein [Mesorhizobium sp.]
MRLFHRLFGLFAAILITILALSGAYLSVLPTLDRAGTVTASGRLSVADVAGRIERIYPTIEQITRTPAGGIVASYLEDGRAVSSVIDPASGRAVDQAAPSSAETWVKDLHRSLFLGDGGRATAGIGAFALLVLTLSGLQMTARRAGGWRRLLRRARGTVAQRLHIGLGKLAALGAVLSTVTALYMSLATFGLIPDGSSQAASALPVAASAGPALPAERLPALQGVELSQLRELTFPDPSDPADAYGLTTTSGEGFVDPATGQILAWQDNGVAKQVYEFIYMLHTGQGLWWLGLMLGASALCVSVLGGAGAAIWWGQRRGRSRISRNAAAASADTVILVGSEGGSTWGFARTLHDALVALGHRVHTAPMNSIADRYPVARRMFVLAATYGDGEAPASAASFLKRIDRMDTPRFPVAVLGFGDRQFPAFCRFARDVETALRGKGWKRLMPLAGIDRQSTQEFSRWGDALSAVMGKAVRLTHVAELPRTQTLTLLERADYGAEVQAPTAILRFSLPDAGLAPRLSGRAWQRFEAGDLIGVMVPGCATPRYYSLASSSRDGAVEICVRKQPGGACSTLLHALRPGDGIQAFVRRNSGFRTLPGRRPVILVGAGAGVGPLAGFIRANGKARPMHLYFGGRHPASDFLYRDEIAGWLGDGRLTCVSAVFSRIAGGGYVQDLLHEDAERLRVLIAGGAQIMVCGGREMALGVMEALVQIISPLGLTPQTLKAQGRYVEDIY